MLSFTFNDGNISTVTTIVYPAFMDAVGVSKAEPCTQSGAVLPDKSPEEELGMTHRTSKWKGRMTKLLLGIPERHQKSYSAF